MHDHIEVYMIEFIIPIVHLSFCSLERQIINKIVQVDQFNKVVGRLRQRMEGEEMNIRENDIVGNNEMLSSTSHNHQHACIKNPNQYSWGKQILLYIKGLVEFVSRWESQQQLKHIEANNHVLIHYHDSYLYGQVPRSIRFRAFLRSGLFGLGWHIV